jgi:ADP-ribose pyrophosphatase
MKRKNGNWTILETKEKFSNGFFKVVEDKVIRPDGKSDRYATIDFEPGASVLPVDDEDNIYLTRQFRYALGRRDLEVISGAIDAGEGPLEAAKRETREELGIEAEEWQEMGKIEADTSLTNSTAHLFLARKLVFGKPDREPSEDIETVKIPLAKGHQMVVDGDITHDQTVILILKAVLERKKGQ